MVTIVDAHSVWSKELAHTLNMRGVTIVGVGLGACGCCGLVDWWRWPLYWCWWYQSVFTTASTTTCYAIKYTCPGSQESRHAAKELVLSVFLLPALVGPVLKCSSAI